MVQSFANKATEDVFNNRAPKGLPPSILVRAKSKLRAINIATTVADLRTPPSNRLEKLSGNRAGQYSIRINDQWRICFIWSNNDAFEVEICDYH